MLCNFSAILLMAFVIMELPNGKVGIQNVIIHRQERMVETHPLSREVRMEIAMSRNLSNIYAPNVVQSALTTR